MNRFCLRVSGTALRVKFKTSPKLVCKKNSCLYIYYGYDYLANVFFLTADNGPAFQ